MLGTAFPPYTWLIGLLIQPLLIAGVINHGIVEEHDLPAELLTGETATATWSLETGSSGGFARFQVQALDKRHSWRDCTFRGVLNSFCTMAAVSSKAPS